MQFNESAGAGLTRNLNMGRMHKAVVCTGKGRGWDLGLRLHSGSAPCAHAESGRRVRRRVRVHPRPPNRG